MNKNKKIFFLILIVLLLLICGIVLFFIKTDIGNKNKIEFQKNKILSPESITLDDEVKTEILNIINIDLENNLNLALSKNKKNDDDIIKILKTLYWDENTLFDGLKKGTLGKRSFQIKQDYNDDIIANNISIIEDKAKFNIENNIISVTIVVFTREFWNQFDIESGRRSVSGGYESYNFKVFKQDGKFYILDKMMLPDNILTTDYSDAYNPND